MVRKFLMLTLLFTIFTNTAYSQDYISSDLKYLKNLVNNTIIKFLKPIIDLNFEDKYRALGGCICSENVAVRNDWKISGKLASLRTDGFKVKECPGSVFRLSAPTQRERIEMAMAWGSIQAIKHMGFSRYEISNLLTCDGVFEIQMTRAIVQGERRYIESGNNLSIFSIDMRNDNYFIINTKSGLAELTAVYDGKGLHITGVKLPFDFVAKTNLANLNESLAKNIDKSAIYLTEAYNELRRKGIIRGNVLGYLRVIVERTYTDGLDFLQEGFKIVERQSK